MKYLGFLKMKYEMFMMRLFDRLVSCMSKNSNLSWYPKFSLGLDDLEGKILDMEIEILDLELMIDDYSRILDDRQYVITQQDVLIDDLQETLDYYIGDMEEGSD